MRRSGAAGLDDGSADARLQRGHARITAAAGPRPGSRRRERARAQYSYRAGRGGGEAAVQLPVSPPMQYIRGLVTSHAPWTVGHVDVRGRCADGDARAGRGDRDGRSRVSAQCSVVRRERRATVLRTCDGRYGAREPRHAALLDSARTQHTIRQVCRSRGSAIRIFRVFEPFRYWNLMTLRSMQSVDRADPRQPTNDADVECRRPS